jgi:hypothetical protein
MAEGQPATQTPIAPKRGRGRPRVWWQQLPPVRLHRALATRLERRLMLLEVRTGFRNLSSYIRRALSTQLDLDDAVDRKAKRAQARAEREKEAASRGGLGGGRRTTDALSPTIPPSAD